MIGITPLKGSKEGKEEFATCDIENEENGDVLAIGLSFREENGEIAHTTFSNWKEFTQYLIVHCPGSKVLSRIWAHNGGGWDWASYFSWLINNRRDFEGLEILPIIVGSKFVLLQMDFGVRYLKNECGEIERSALFTVKLCDSLYLLRSPLEKLSRKFLGKGKTDISGMMPWDLYHQDRKKFFEYLETDCENLLRILERFYALIREELCPLDHLGSTIGSTALRLYRHMMPNDTRVTKVFEDGKETIKEKRLNIIIPTDEAGHKDFREFLRLGYYGGRVEVFKYGHFSRVNVFDINSLYPFVMRENSYPVNPDTYFVEGGKLPRGVNGVFEVEFNQHNKSIAPVLMFKGKSIYSGTGIYFSPELHLLEKLGADIKVKRGYIFRNCQPIFRGFIDKLWGIRKADYEGPLGLVCKFIMNSLYGKFCERPKIDKLLMLSGTTWENIQKIVLMEDRENAKREKKGEGKIKVEPLDEANGAYLIHDENNVCNNEHVGIGGLITSWARVELYKRFLEAGYENLIYCDTDSIHTLGTLQSGVELGELKCEHTGEAVYCGKKLYALRGIKNGKTYEKVTAKGVAFCSREQSQPHKFILTFDDMRGLLDGREIKTSFSQPASAKEVMKGEKPCRIMRYENGRVKHNRKRTLRKV